jgi:DNA (cytosine-5)-methyltransferase 1
MDGEVDERSIIDVDAADLQGFTQHHFFSGIGGWQYALRLAGWGDSRPVCTASLPCQPFSVAGSGKGKDDERHLLPHFIELVQQCNFKTIFGEQVSAAIRHGWLDDLCFEMERENYAVGSIVLTAAGAGAPHIRQRLYWAADSIDKGSQGRLSGRQDKTREVISGHAGRSGSVGGVVYPDGTGSQQGRESTKTTIYRDSIKPASGTSRLGNAKSDRRNEGTKNGTRNTERDNTEGASGRPTCEKSGSHATSIHNSEARQDSTGEFTGAGSPTLISEWTDPNWLYCRDNKYRPIKPGIKPLANGLPKGMGYSSDTSEPINADDTQEARVMRLKGYGNAIVPQVAAQFISAFMAVQQ